MKVDFYFPWKHLLLPTIGRSRLNYGCRIPLPVSNRWGPQFTLTISTRELLSILERDHTCPRLNCDAQALRMYLADERQLRLSMYAYIVGFPMDVKGLGAASASTRGFCSCLHMHTIYMYVTFKYLLLHADAFSQHKDISRELTHHTTTPFITALPPMSMSDKALARDANQITIDARRVNFHEALHDTKRCKMIYIEKSTSGTSRLLETKI